MSPEEKQSQSNTRKSDEQEQAGQKEAEELVKASEPNQHQGQTYPEKHPLELKLPPVLVFGLFALAMWVVSIYLPVFAIDIPFGGYFTGFLMITAVLTGAYSMVLFYKKKANIVPFNPEKSTVLVTDGPFQHTRNPMYLSLALVLIGWAVFLSDLLSLMLIPLFIVYMNRFQIIPEERELDKAFGETYRDYVDRTPRWL